MHLKSIMPALMALSTLSSQAADFSQTNAEGYALDYTILQTEEGAVPEVEISGFTKNPEQGEYPTFPVPTLTLPGNVIHDGVEYKVTAIGENAFKPKKIKSLIIEEGVKTIKWEAFWGAGLTSVSLPNTLVKLESYCFYGNDFKTIYIPDNVSSISQYSFIECNNLKSIEVSPNNNFYKSDGVLYNNEVTTLIYCPPAKDGELTIPSSVNIIGAYSFYKNKCIKSLRFPANANINIETSAFDGSNIEDVDFPDSSEFEIGSGCFFNCPRLKHVYIGAGVKSLSEFPFAECWNLKDLTISPDNPNYYTDGIAIYNKEKTSLICILDSSEGDYAIPSTISTIEWTVSEGGKKLHSLTIPKSTTTIAGSYPDGCLSGRIIIENPDPNTIQLKGYDGTVFSKNRATSIIVPSESVSAYKKAWPDYADMISSEDYMMDIVATVPLSTKKTVIVPVSLANAEDIIGFQCDIHLPWFADIAVDKNNKYAVTLSERADRSHTVTCGTPSDVSSIYYTTSKVVRVVCISLTNAKIKNNDGVLFQIPIEMSDVYDAGNNVLAIDNIHLSKPGNIRVDVPPVRKSFRALDYTPGDVDDDGMLSVVDVTASVAHMVGADAENFVLSAADFDSDGAVMINDITTLIDMVLNNVEEPATISLKAATENETEPAAEYTMTFPNVTVQKGADADLVVSMTNKEPVLGFQCDITLPEGVTIKQIEGEDSYDFILNPERCVDHMVVSTKVANKENTYRVMAVSLSNTTLNGNSGEIFSCPLTVDAPAGEYDITLSRIILSANGSKRVDIPDVTGLLTVNEYRPTGIQDVVAEENDENVQYYDLMGRPADASTRGIIVSKKGKILVK